MKNLNNFMNSCTIRIIFGLDRSACCALQFIPYNHPVSMAPSSSAGQLKCLKSMRKFEFQSGPEVRHHQNQPILLITSQPELQMTRGSYILDQRVEIYQISLNLIFSTEIGSRVHTNSDSRLGEFEISLRPIREGIKGSDIWPGKSPPFKAGLRP